HTPVDFKWLDSVINDWKKADGRSLRGREYFSFVFNAEEDWKKLLKKYGQTMDAYGHRLSVPHPSDTAWLEVTKDGELCNALVMVCDKTPMLLNLDLLLRLDRLRMRRYRRMTMTTLKYQLIEDPRTSSS
uniref:SCP2 domain-containing protein n=1 Tax=Steinernema glaseri TaxID=37863 RepID=A0A1I7YUB4_9BILA